jgi:hypothetical protein
MDEKSGETKFKILRKETSEKVRLFGLYED